MSTLLDSPRIHDTRIRDDNTRIRDDHSRIRYDHSRIRDDQGDVRIRRALRDQIARLERQVPAAADPTPDRGARLLSAAELERIRDGLVRRMQERRFTGGEEQERKRILREKMVLEPAKHFGQTVSNAEVGEPGCTRWASWFRLRISGGCP